MSPHCFCCLLIWGAEDASLRNPSGVLACRARQLTKPQTFPAEENSLSESCSRVWRREVTTGLVYVKLRMSHVTPKRIGINLLYKTKHWKKKAFSLIKEPRQKSHLIYLTFPFPLTQLVCRCRAAWQKLWTFGKGSHYWKSLTHTSLGMLLMSWKAGTLAITPNNQSYSKQ